MSIMTKVKLIAEPELDVDWIHPWIGLDWIGLDWIGSKIKKKILDWIGLGQGLIYQNILQCIPEIITAFVYFVT